MKKGKSVHKPFHIAMYDFRFKCTVYIIQVYILNGGSRLIQVPTQTKGCLSDLAEVFHWAMFFVILNCSERQTA